MSVSIATMGMFNQCCGGTGYGGGAPPYRPYSEDVKPLVLVRNVELVDIRDPEDYKKISVKLKDD